MGLYPREAVRFRLLGLELGGERHLVGSLADLVGLVGVVLHYDEPWVGIHRRSSWRLPVRDTVAEPCVHAFPCAYGEAQNSLGGRSQKNL